MVHVALVQNVLRLLERHGVGWDPLPALGVIAASVAGSLLVAWMLFTFVEKPAMRLLTRRRRSATHTSPAGARLG
ncbi:peptidoglycan/LPS O-acetylase OafA/YrhL [Actinoplanes campanulatus]|uniref:Peptidoglycan/LPS O-acetylase OafA/YrhL n=1 Tax=Actinoplanes campanulatus TaxID=113559 RepID=A0A7W5AE92_9ACTN|nr:hypothetical protein [Actinoplanes campanulatus]MBB3094447.1 peptidoglycan/LPS O-acetylase OafA/YrhL [Actinoplanes campanulatus]GGN21104.1 hypothetical protein GCM10010109_35110 [Actinoplanes campanulatus]GID35639.1 hypothetical protein Aca09nite_21450 [Actinoplanes campanulatus]